MLDSRQKLQNPESATLGRLARIATDIQVRSQGRDPGGVS